MTREIAIRLTNVSKYFKLYNSNRDRLKEVLHPFGKKYHHNYFALRNVNLEIFQGEILGIVGRNGSGKSTLLKIITSVLYANVGTVDVRGRISALLELGTGFNPEFTGLENVSFYGVVNGFSEEFMRSNLDKIIAFADIGEYINQPLKHYSSGMKSRLAFAVAVHVDPDILIIDEVLAVGDVAFQEKCYRKIRTFFNSGKTVILVSHSYDNIVSLCDRAVLIVDGKIVMDGVPKNVLSLYKNLVFSPKKTVEELLSESNEDNSSENKVRQVAPVGPTEKYSNEYGQFEGLQFVDTESNHPQNKHSLRKNSIYKISTTFTPYVNLKNAWFGVQVRTLNGIIVSGVNQRDFSNHDGYELSELQSVEIDVTINCLLNSGNYVVAFFMVSDNNCSVLADEFASIEVHGEEKNGGLVKIFSGISANPTQRELVSGIAGGAWSEQVHELLHPANFNFGFAKFLCDNLAFSSVLEFGSGLGSLAKFISEHKALDCYHCIEPNRIKGLYKSDGNPRLFSLDIFVDRQPEEIARTYELVCSIEVAEHIHRDKHDYLFDFLVDKASKWIVFSGASVGQGGHGHVSERDEEDWKSEFLKRGCIFSRELTANIRRACDKKNINHAKNLMVFHARQ